MKFRLLLLVALSGTVFGQAVSYSSNVTQTANNVPFGASAPIMSTPNALVTVCSYPPTGTPCTNTVNVFQDQAMTTPFTQPLTADPKGRFLFWAPAAQYFVSVQTASGANVGGYPLTLGGAGGGATFPGTVTQAIASAGSGAAFASKATFDAAGNFKSRTNDGLFNAFLNQSAPGANDGIRRSLQTPGNFVVAGNDYACTEGDYSSNGYMLGIGVPAPFADATELINQRGVCGAQGNYIYNPYYNATPGTWLRDRIVENHLPSNAVSNFFYTSDTEFSGSGINDGFLSGGPDTQGLFFHSFEYMTRGIQSVFNIEQQALSLGDNHIWQNQITNNRGSNDPNGEGFNTIRNQIGQNLTPLVMTANSTLAAGATLIQGTLINNIPFPGDGTYLTDTTKGGPQLLMTSDAVPGGNTAGQLTITGATLTPDNIGNITAGVSTPKQRYGLTTNETVTVTGLTSALNTTQTVCVADNPFQESARVVNAGSFSGGTATGVVLALRYVHQAGAYLAQGSHACNFLEIKANEAPGTFPARQLVRIIGALPSNTFLYSRTVFGGWRDALSGYAGTYVIAPAGTTLTRNGSNVVTVPVSDGNFILSNVNNIVSNCADSSFNGTYHVTSDNGAAVTWANTGAAGTTTCTSPIEVQSQRSGPLSIRSAQEFPGAEIVNTVDPVTFANNFNLTVEPNTNFQVTAADRLENNDYSDVMMGWDRNLMDFSSQTSGIDQVMHADQVTGLIPEGIAWARITFADSPLGYRGLGGSKKIGAKLMDMTSSTLPFGEIFFNFPTPSDALFTFQGCLYGCTDPRSQFTLFSIPTGAGFFTEKIFQDSGLLRMSTFTTLASYQREESGAGLGIVNTSSLIGGASDIYFLHTDELKNVIQGPAGSSSTTDQLLATITNSVSNGINTSHVTQTVTSTSSDVPYVGPVTAPSGACTVNGGWVFSQDGHATFCSAGTWVVKI